MTSLRHEVHVWLGDDLAGETELDVYSSLLGEDERSRADRFRFFADRRRFVVAHALLRMIPPVYDYVQSAGPLISRRCALCNGEDHGKPYFVDPTGRPAGLRLSISYSDGLVALAFSDGREVGVDVETARPGSVWSEVAGHVFSSAEKGVLAGLDADAARRAFYRVWTRKEAASKVSGRGLTHAAEMDTCAWTYPEEGAFEVPGEVPWSGQDLDLDDPHYGAVAAQGRVDAFRYFRVDHGEVLESLRRGSFVAGHVPARELVRHGVG